jgi:AcrR family transcriptional regulator
MANPPPPALADSSKVDSTSPPGMRTIRGLDAHQRREQRREQLLAAALELIARDGYANTSIEQICQTAYVGNKAFYELFDSKEDCYVALLSQLMDSTEQQVLEAMQQSPADEHEMARRMVAAFAHAMIDDPRTALVTLRDVSGISPAVERQRRQNRRRAASVIEAFWRQHHHDDGIDYQVLAIATLGGLLEVAADWLHESDTSQPLPADSLIDKLNAFVSVVQAGIAAQSISRAPVRRRPR